MSESAVPRSSTEEARPSSDSVGPDPRVRYSDRASASLFAEIGSRHAAEVECLARIYTGRAEIVAVDDMLAQQLRRVLMEVAVSAGEAEATVLRNQEVEQFADRLRWAFESEPFEDGMDHPADEVLESALRSDERAAILAWLTSLFGGPESPTFLASVLRCLGRQDPGTTEWKVGVVRMALTHDHLEVRDAALQAAESWAGVEMVRILRAHDEPVAWLAESIDQVVSDLGS